MTFNEMEDAINRIAELQVKKAVLESSRAKALLEVNERYKPQLSVIDPELKALILACTKFAKEHRNTIFPSGSKTSETALATFSLAISAPALQPFAGTTWKKVLELLEENNLQEFIMHIPDVDREKIKTKMLNEKMLRMPEGKLRITRDEKLTVTLKKK